MTKERDKFLAEFPNVEELDVTKIVIEPMKRIYPFGYYRNDKKFRLECIKGHKGFLGKKDLGWNVIGWIDYVALLKNPKEVFLDFDRQLWKL